MRPVQQFSDGIRNRAEHVIQAMVEVINVDDSFGKVSGDVGAIELAAGVMQGQLGTPKDTVRYALSLNDDDGNPLKGDQTYEVTIPPGIVVDTGYMSLTVYGSDNKLLIPNDMGHYNRTNYSMEPNEDDSYTMNLSPDGSGTNGIPTGKDFYAVTQAYVPIQNISISPSIKTK